MKQAEKNKRSRDMILTFAFTEFAEYGYAGSGINQICTKGNISKGLLYHYYSNKDALYIACVTKLFQDMICFLREQINLDTLTVEEYYSVRMQFF